MTARYKCRKCGGAGHAVPVELPWGWDSSLSCVSVACTECGHVANSLICPCGKPLTHSRPLYEGVEKWCDNDHHYTWSDR